MLDRKDIGKKIISTSRTSKLRDLLGQANPAKSAVPIPWEPVLEDRFLKANANKKRKMFYGLLRAPQPLRKTGVSSMWRKQKVLKQDATFSRHKRGPSTRQKGNWIINHHGYGTGK